MIWLQDLSLGSWNASVDEVGVARQYQSLIIGIVWQAAASWMRQSWPSMGVIVADLPGVRDFAEKIRRLPKKYINLMIPMTCGMISGSLTTCNSIVLSEELV